MGYSKYTEDIEKIHSMNIFGTFLDWQPTPVLAVQRCDFCSFETYDRVQRDAHILTCAFNFSVLLSTKGTLP